MSGNRQWTKPEPVTRVPFVPKFAPSQEQAAIFNDIRFGTDNLHVNAAAGSGKTTTNIWATTLERNPQPTLMMAFNKDIVTEMEPKAPDHVVVKTAHGIGYGVIAKYIGGKPEMPKGYETKNEIILKGHSEFSQAGLRGIQKGDQRQLLKNFARLVSLIKLTLTDERDEVGVARIIDRYGLDFKVNGGKDDKLMAALSILPEVMDQHREMLQLIDFDDMVWLPIQYDMQYPVKPWVYVDEAQDLNKAMQETARRCVGDRIVTVGDKFQSVYGFMGSDSNSIDNLIKMFGSSVYPLMTCYRCDKNIIEYIQKVMPDIKYFEGNGEGEVNHHYETDKPYDFNQLPDGALVLCRRNAGLVRPCFSLLKQGRKAIIKGKDIGYQLADLVDMLVGQGCDSMIKFLDRLEVWKNEKINAIESRTNPSEEAINLVQDQHDALKAIGENCESPFHVKNKITSIFADKSNGGVVFSSIHKSKGLEADHVVVVQAGKIRMHNEKMKPEDHLQEINLDYVCRSRAKHVYDLVYND